jgi:hypothetical protein
MNILRVFVVFFLFLFLCLFFLCVILYTFCMFRGAYAFYKISLITFQKIFRPMNRTRFKRSRISQEK